MSLTLRACALLGPPVGHKDHQPGWNLRIDHPKRGVASAVTDCAKSTQHQGLLDELKFTYQPNGLEGAIEAFGQRPGYPRPGLAR